MATAVGPVAVRRPETVKWAVILIVAEIVVGFLALFTPSGDDIPGAVIVIGSLFNMLTLVCTWGLWNLRKWGAIGAFVLVLLNTIAAAPGLFADPDGWLLTELLFIILTSGAALVLIALRASRTSYH
jgi:hypothetical protein